MPLQKEHFSRVRLALSGMWRFLSAVGWAWSRSLTASRGEWKVRLVRVKPRVLSGGLPFA